MKQKRKIIRLSVLLVSLLLMITIVSAENLYQQDSLVLELDVQGSLELVGESSSSTVKQASAELLLFPQESFRQKIVEMDTKRGSDIQGEIISGKNRPSILFQWDNPSLGTKNYGYTAKVKTLNQKNSVNKKIAYPLEDIKGYEQYTLPTEKIDSNHPAIIAKAKELAEGEDDLFKVAFNLASWVSGNVKYDLNDLTTNTAQKASWVLENRQGVCDEMTSLFVAMARSLGLPARFVSGISYTEDPSVVRALGKNWAGHGWAEVYFPDVGWVSFDIAFDEFGYIDVTHIKLREGLDPDEPATTFEWLADEVNLVSKGLEQDVEILDRGTFVPEAITLEEELLAEEVDFGSYNLVKGIIKNKENNYAVTTLKISVPEEVEIIGQNKRQILLTPKEVRETFWIIKISERLEENYWYQFPVVMYSEKNRSVEDIFKAQNGKAFFSRKEIEDLVVNDEEKSYSRKIAISCDYQREIQPDRENIFRCTIKNNGDLSLNSLSYCLEDVCEQISLNPDEEKIQEVKIIEQTPGWHHLVVSAENSEVEKKVSMPFIVMDKADLSAEVHAPSEAAFDDEILMTITLDKTSFTPPKKVIVTVQGLGIVQTFELEELLNTQEFKITFPKKRAGFKNTITVSVEWNDDPMVDDTANDTPMHWEQQVVFTGKATSLKDKAMMMLNSVLNLLR